MGKGGKGRSPPRRMTTTTVVGAACDEEKKEEGTPTPPPPPPRPPERADGKNGEEKKAPTKEGAASKAEKASRRLAEMLELADKGLTIVSVILDGGSKVPVVGGACEVARDVLETFKRLKVIAQDVLSATTRVLESLVVMQKMEDLVTAEISDELDSDDCKRAITRLKKYLESMLEIAHDLEKKGLIRRMMALLDSRTKKLTTLDDDVSRELERLDRLFHLASQKEMFRRLPYPVEQGVEDSQGPVDYSKRRMKAEDDDRARAREADWKQIYGKLLAIAALRGEMPVAAVAQEILDLRKQRGQRDDDDIGVMGTIPEEDEDEDLEDSSEQEDKKKCPQSDKVALEIETIKAFLGRAMQSFGTSTDDEDMQAIVEQAELCVEVHRAKRDDLDEVRRQTEVILLARACHSNDVKALSQILEKRPTAAVDVLDKVVANFRKMRPIHVACVGGALDVVKLLARSGARADDTDEEGRTAFLHAVAHDRFDVVNFLYYGLGKQVDLDRPDKKKRTALMRAASEGRFDAVSWLLDKGADKTLADAKGRDALFYVRYHRNNNADIQKKVDDLLRNLDRDLNRDLNRELHRRLVDVAKQLEKFDYDRSFREKITKNLLNGVAAASEARPGLEDLAKKLKARDHAFQQVEDALSPHPRPRPTESMWDLIFGAQQQQQDLLQVQQQQGPPPLPNNGQGANDDETGQADESPPPQPPQSWAAQYSLNIFTRTRLASIIANSLGITNRSAPTTTT